MIMDAVNEKLNCNLDRHLLESNRCAKSVNIKFAFA
jgi:hypothetical protein